MKNRKRFSLDVSLKPGRCLLEGGQLDVLQRVLVEDAPEWAKQARVWRSRTEQWPVDLTKPNELVRAIHAYEAWRAPIKERYAKLFGDPRSRRFIGSIELQAARRDDLTVLVSVDQHVLARIADFWILGNWITFQLRRSKVDGVDAAAWSTKVFASLCEALSPFYGEARMTGEYDKKNMIREGGRVEAIGVDYSRHLPGLYWLNYFGEPYCGLIGRDRLLSAPAREVRSAGKGILMRLADDPRMWSTEEYRSSEARVLEHIGTQYFFSRQDPKRKTVAPNFGDYLRGSGK